MLYFHIPDQFCLARKYDTQNISLMCDHLDQLCQKVVICHPEAWISCALRYCP